MSRSSRRKNGASDTHGPHAFDRHYEQVYGDRWPVLRTALIAPPHQVALPYPLKTPYYLDDASRAAADALPLSPGDRVIDFCAAPGGKSLALAVRLPEDATLISNERSATRRARLHRVLDDHLPETLRARVTVTGHDATRWGVVHPASAQRILLDVPCSSERHVITDSTHLARWSAARTRSLSIQAFALLAAAIDTLVEGGTVLYITCALSPRENDDVVARAFSRRAGLVEQRRLDLPWGEETRHGIHVLPDRANGRGPLYVALLEKVASR
ncbi:MAG: RsmB/NOP family class I SAM-dependent RNA methyltransferase [Spirochaetaceae bacterium]|nr:MAG: RsmB/NOP family class I SAM-dependent RNA methyltransferase [Spirochaetaceae bacterium]